MILRWLLLLLVLLTCACGQKGDLYLPDSAAPPPARQDNPG